MRTIALGDSAYALQDLYIPLTLVRGYADDADYIIDGLPSELFADHKRIIIRDTAGMGKSTVTKYIFLECINKNQYI